MIEIRFIVTGCEGSIGKRHASNLLSLGHEVIGIDIDDNKRGGSSLKEVYKTKEEAPLDCIDAVFICSPTSEHINDAMFFASKSINIFVEKPLSYNMDNVSALVSFCKRNNVKLMVAENLRFNKGIELVKILLDRNIIGKVFACNYIYGQWLPDWRPNTDYKKNYSSTEFGGICRDDVHAPSLMLHFFGSVNKSMGILHTTNILDIEEEEIADYIIQHKNGIISHIHSNYLLPFYTRNLEVLGTDGIIQWSFEEQEVYLRTKKLDEWRIFNCSEETNSMYLKQMQYYISCLENNINPYHNGIESIKITNDIRYQNLVS